MTYENLSPIQFDALREIGNIGAGNAATALSQLLDQKVNMVIPTVKIVTFDEMMDLIGGPDASVVAILFRVFGDAPLHVFFVLSIEEAELLVQTMTHNPTFSLMDENSANKINYSVLEEVGNIVAGSYISALSDFTNLNFQPSVPHLGIDMAAAILTYGLIDISQVSDYAIVIDSKVNSEDSDNTMKGNLFLLPHPESLQTIFSSLGIKEYE